MPPAADHQTAGAVPSPHLSRAYRSSSLTSAFGINAVTATPERERVPVAAHADRIRHPRQRWSWVAVIMSRRFIVPQDGFQGLEPMFTFGADCVCDDATGRV